MEAIGLIGFGRFGQLLYKYIASDYIVTIYDPHKQQEPDFETYPFAALEEVAYNPLVIIATPISAIESVARNIAPLVRPETIIMDVCSVKNYPLNVLNEYLPEYAEIIGSHPLFGPESVTKSLRGKTVILSPIYASTKSFEKIKAFWKGLGVRSIAMSPTEHDRVMAWTLALSHFLGRGLGRLTLPSVRLSTKDYRILRQLIDLVNRDSIQLFQDMHRFNPFTREMRKQVLRELQILNDELDHMV